MSDHVMRASPAMSVLHFYTATKKEALLKTKMATFGSFGSRSLHGGSGMKKNALRRVLLPFKA